MERARQMKEMKTVLFSMLFTGESVIYLQLIDIVYLLCKKTRFSKPELVFKTRCCYTDFSFEHVAIYYSVPSDITTEFLFSVRLALTKSGICLSLEPCRYWLLGFLIAW